MTTKIIDLTRIINEQIMVYPGTPEPQINRIFSIEEDGFMEHLIAIGSHTGTHIDAPCHVLKNGKSIDQFLVDKFTGKAIVIPCHDQKELTVDYLKTFGDKIAHIDFILFFTGWQFKWKTQDYITSCPVPTIEAAKWLTNFNLKGIGFDAFSADKLSSEIISFDTLPNHFIFLEKEILIIENLTNLDKLPDTIFTFHCLPLYLENIDGSPIRAIATIND